MNGRNWMLRKDIAVMYNYDDFLDMSKWCLYEMEGSRLT